MPNPNENNTPVKNKEKANKEFAQENETPQKENINLESNYKSQGNGPISVNSEVSNESRAIGHNTPKSKRGSAMMGDRSANPKSKRSGSSMRGDLSQHPKSKHSGSSMRGDISSNKNIGSMGTAPKEYVTSTPEGEFPKIDRAPNPGEMLTEKETTEDSSKQEAASGDTPGTSGGPEKKAPKKKEKEGEILASGELGKALGLLNSDSSKDEKKISTESGDEEAAKTVDEAKKDIEASQQADNANKGATNENVSGTGGEGENTSSIDTEKEGESKDKKASPEAEALAAFEVKETDTEKDADTQIAGFKNEGKNQGLMVGRSMGYGAKLVPSSDVDKPFSITTFSESGDPAQEEEAKKKYNEESDKSAKSMELFGSESDDKGGKNASPKEGYYDAYIEGYNEGYREGAALKKEAAAAERNAQMKEEQGTEEYKVGASLGMTCGILTAKGEKEVDTKFSMTKDGEYTEVIVKTTVAELDSAAFDKKQTPGGELSGPAYEKAFLIHYNMGYREVQNKRNQPPPMDDDYKLGYNQGYKLGSQKGSGQPGDEDLVAIETAYDAKDQKTLEKDELQQYRGFYVGYNKGYAQVKKAKRNKAQTEREEKYKKPNFVAGYSTGNLKGFLTAMIEPSGIDLLTALNDPKKMEEAGIPSFFPIPDSLRESIKATLVHGDVPDNDTESDSTKALLGKPLFKEGLLMGYNQGYSHGQKSRSSFKRDKHKMHPDYQRSRLVLMAAPFADSEYKGPAENGSLQEGYAMGQILANADFELKVLTSKKERSEKEEKRFGDLTKVVASLNGIIAKESSYYKLGIDEFYNWWLGKLNKKARDKKVQEGYSGADGSPKRLGFEWGNKVGDEVIKGKDKLKEIKRKGRDIKDRSAALNKTIKETDAKAKVTSKNKGGEEYYLGYRNGYNHAFRAAKEGKKSDQGNLDAGDLLENAGNVGSQHIKEIYPLITSTLNLGVNLSKEDFGTAIQNAKTKFEGETKKAFEAGLSIGYDSGYDSNKINVETGKPMGENEGVEDSKKIEDKYKGLKTLKDEEDKLKYTERIALGVLYFFLMGYQLHNKEKLKTKYGLPKGISDAQSFNIGYKDAQETSSSGKVVDSSAEANSKDAYKAGYDAALYRARYEKFKKGMVLSSLANNTEEQGAEDSESNKAGETNRSVPANQKGEGTSDNVQENGGESSSSVSEEKGGVDGNLTGGLALLADNETESETNTKHEEEDAVSDNKFYIQGNEDAGGLWSKIIFLRKGVKLSSTTVPEEVTFKLGGEFVTLKDDVDQAAQYYFDKEALVEQLAEEHIEANFSWGLFMDLFALDWGALSDAWRNYDKAKAQQKQNYIKGYKAKIKSIENSYKGDLIDDWLYNCGYYDAVTEVAPDAQLAIPSGPYTSMSGDDRDESNPYYKTGFLEGVKMGNRIKNGLVQPSNADLAEQSGGDTTRGFNDGQKVGKEDGEKDAKDPTKELPSREDREDALEERLDEEYRAKHNGENDGMNGDYEDAYIDAYFSTYWEVRDYEYGRSLGYDRGALGGDAMYNLEPEEGVVIKNQDAFFKGFDAGREAGVLGLSKDSLYKDEDKDDGKPTNQMAVIKKLTSKYAARNAAIDAIGELKLEEKTIRKVAYAQDSFYGRYSELSSIKALGLSERGAGGGMMELLISYEVEDLTVISEYLEEGFQEHLETSFVECSSEERSTYWNAFKESYEEAYRVIYAQSLAELTPVAMTAQFDQRKDVGGAMGGGEAINSGLGESGNDALDVLKDLLFGGTQDFYLDNILLLRMFYNLESEIEKVQHNIEEDLNDIKDYRTLADLFSGSDKSDYEDLAKLEKELEEENLTKKQRKAKTKERDDLKKLISSKDIETQETYKKWQAAEAAAKEKIDSIRVLMKDSLAFETPLESNEDILTYIKINLESSKGNDEDIYEDIDIFNELFLGGTFNYKESEDVNVSIVGDGYFSVDHFAENAYIQDADIQMKKNGFEFKSRGLYYIKEDTINFMQGSIVTPSIEGGAHMGEQYVYSFDEFSVHLGQGIKSQIDAQKYKLEGGPM